MGHETGRRARLGALGVVAALGFGILTAMTPTATTAGASTCTHDPVLCPNRLYVGESVDGLNTNLTATIPFAQATGVSPSLVLNFAGFGDTMNTTALRRLSAEGRLPMVTWEPYLYTTPTANPYPLQQIAAGTFDSYLRAQGAALAAVGAPVAIRFAHEMNSNWYPWGQGVNGNTTADYIAAYRHVHDVVTAAGATNVLWVWSPNVNVGSATTPLAPLYPGDSYVDWVAVDAYMDSPTSTFAKLFPATLTQIDQFAPTKPIYVAETAVLPGANRPAMIHDLVTGLLGVRRLVGFTWFDHSTRMDWRIENDPAAAAQLAAELASPRFGGAGHVDDSQVTVAPIAQAYSTLSASVGALGYPLTNAYPTQGGGWTQLFQGGGIHYSPTTGAQAVIGAIAGTYDGMRGESGPLGYPVSGQYPTQGGGWTQLFQGGGIHYSPTTGAQAVLGSIASTYDGMWGESGPLGYPRTGQYPTQGGGSTQLFQGGGIHSSPVTGAKPVLGAIATTYDSLRGESGALGYPLTASYPTTGGGSAQLFQGGGIHWSPTTGARPVVGAIARTYDSLWGESGLLGYPVNSQYGIAGGRVRQDFQRGSLFWNPQTGAVTFS